MTSTTSSFSSLVAIQELLKTPEKLLGIILKFNFQSQEQQKLQKALESLGDIEFPELERIAQIGDVALVNKFLTDHGMTIQLEPVSPDDIVAAIYFKISSKWLIPGKDDYLFIKQQYVPAIAFTERTVMQNENFIFSFLKLENDDEVLLAEPLVNNGDFISSISIEGIGKTILNSYKGHNFEESECKGIKVPKIDIRQRRTLHEILGLSTDNGYHISQALAEFILQVNEEGLKVEVAMAFAMEKGICRDNTKYWEIEKPFYLFLVRKNQILFSAYLAEDSWKEPVIEV